MSWSTGLRLATGTTTIIRVGPLPEIDRRTAGRAMLLTPLAVVPVALIAAAATFAAGRTGLPQVACGAVGLAVLAIGSRAMHLDGLADTVDGLGGGWTKERALEIMRRGDVGPMGVVALLLVLLIQAACLGAVSVDARGALVAFLAICLSRGATGVVALRRFPPARPDGLGSLVAGSVTTMAAAASVLLQVVVLTAATWWWQCADGMPHRWWLGTLAAIAVSAGAYLVAVVAARRLGGVTGDVFGAAVEVGLVIGIAVLAGGST